jgi:hypothetical protein
VSERFKYGDLIIRCCQCGTHRWLSPWFRTVVLFIYLILQTLHYACLVISVNSHGDVDSSKRRY